MSELADGVYRYLVRYGAPGFVGRFGAIRRIDAPRGARVVVATERGWEAGEVLLGAEDVHASQDRRPPAGELLRVMTDEDLAREAELRGIHLPVLERCRRLLAERGLEVAVMDGETLLDGRRVILYFLGPPSEKLGPLAVELGQETGALHVQFQSLETAGAALAPGADSGEEALPAAMVDAKPPSRQETIKRESAAHWPAIARALADPSTTRLVKDHAFLLQLHGVYQQEDRDWRPSASGARLGETSGAASGRRHSLMIRTRPPGGRLTAAQMLTQLALADRYGRGALRLTARQGLQLHGVAKGEARRVVQEIHASLLTTLGACGDGARNVVCCPAPLRGDRVRMRLQVVAAEIARHLTPRSPAYYEIWLDEEPWPVADAADEEPLFGRSFLPRKFKVGLAPPGDNCVDIYTQDVGLIAVADGERLLGFDVLVGGGLGVSPKRADTEARLAEPLAFVPAGDELRVIDAIVQVYRDHGQRRDRRRARLKYFIADEGIARFKTLVEERLEQSLALPRGARIAGYDDHLGWRQQGDGQLFLGVPILCGRIQDTATQRLKTALRQALQRCASPVRLTPQQNLLLCDLAPERQGEIAHIFETCGVELVEAISPVRRHALACPALPTCGLALTEAERLLPQLLDEVEQELARRGLERESWTLRVAGCSNACARTATADIALVGRSAGKYALHIGGGLPGDRLNRLYRDNLPQERLVEEIVALLTIFQQHRRAGEPLGACLNRLHPIL